MFKDRLIRITSAQAIAFCLILILGMGLRVSRISERALWVDEAESAINAMSILKHGVPVDHFLGQPLYENTLHQFWPESEEYEFRDSSYFRGVAVYHGWVPLFAQALAFKLAEIAPLSGPDMLGVQTTPEQRFRMTIVPRLPAIAFSLCFMIALFYGGSLLGGAPAAWATLLAGAIFSEAVEFGSFARYYSVTLLLSVLLGILIWRASRRPTMLNAVVIGLLMALLFHSHMLSAFSMGVLYALMLLTAPRFRRCWKWHPLVIFVIAAPPVFGWIYATGFLQQASNIPSAWQIMDLPWDLLTYPANRWLVALPIICLFLWAAVAMFFGHLLPHRLRRLGKAAAPRCAFCMSWAVIVYLCFNLLIPVASHFSERITLMLVPPYLLLCGVASALFARALFSRTTSAVAVAICLIILTVTGRVAQENLRGMTFERLEALMEHLDGEHFASKAKIYATPNDHLILTYYSGMPIQSIAPVRKSFLDSWPGDMYFIEPLDRAWNARQIRSLARKNDHVVSRETSSKIAQVLAEQELFAWLSSGTSIDLTEIESPIREILAEYEHQTRQKNLKINERNILALRGYGVVSHRQWWQTFFYRFAGVELRTGANLNFAERFTDSKPTLVMDAGYILYHSPPSSQYASLEMEGL